MTDPTWNWGESPGFTPSQTNNPDYHAQRQTSNTNAATSFSSANYFQPQQPPASDQWQQWNAAPAGNAAYGGHGSSSFYAAPAPADPYTPAPSGGSFSSSTLLGTTAPFPQQFMSDPIFNTARQIGGQFAEQQRERLTNYLSSFQLKYYFSVDTKYVGKKLGVILFPFLHQDWTTKFGPGGAPLAAREDLNAPDLYIPLMAFITYVIVAGFVFGLQKRFSPEKLGMLTTNALFYLILENVLVFITKYLLNISQSLNVWHALSYSSYKFVGMVACLLLYLVGGSSIYYFGLAYCIFATVFFLLRSLKTFILDIGYSGDGGDGRKRKLYLLLSITVLQSIIMWLLTSFANFSSVTSYMPDKYDFAKMAIGLAKSSAGQLPSFSAPDDMPLHPDGEFDYEALLKMS